MKSACTFAALAAPLLASAVLGAPAAVAFNPVQIENSQLGTAAWQTTYPDAANHSEIEGYASQVSAAPGDTIQLHASTAPAARYRIMVFRLGWYRGVGGRLIKCIPACGSDEQGAPQVVPAPDPSTGVVRARWPVTDQVTIGADWVSGYYEIQFQLTSGPHQGEGQAYPLIVRAASAAPASTVLVQASVNTWQAYNGWGGKSLYAFNSANSAPAVKVSFDRPFISAGTQNPFDWEYQFVRWIESHGYDVAYTTDLDTNNAPGELLRHVLDVVNGHDEYWTGVMRDGFDAARNAGNNLIFTGANVGFWKARYEDLGRTLVEYRSSQADPDPQPAEKTVPFGALSPPRPQCLLSGLDFSGILPSGTPAPAYSAEQGALTDPLFTGAGFDGVTPVAAVVGYEYDRYNPACGGPPVRDLFHWQAGPGSPGSGGGTPSADATFYRASSGAGVFAAGTEQFSWALDDTGVGSARVDARVQRFMLNVLGELAGAAPGSCPLPGLSCAAPPPTPASRPAPPCSTLRLGSPRLRRGFVYLPVCVASPGLISAGERKLLKRGRRRPVRLLVSRAHTRVTGPGKLVLRLRLRHRSAMLLPRGKRLRLEIVVQFASPSAPVVRRRTRLVLVRRGRRVYGVR